MQKETQNVDRHSTGTLVIKEKKDIKKIKQNMVLVIYWLFYPYHVHMDSNSPLAGLSKIKLKKITEKLNSYNNS